MTNHALTVEDLSKKYVLGHVHADLLSERLSDLFRGASHGGNRHAQTDFWALQDVSFQVQEGEVLGIMGRNGAGKSTLLKILSRLTSPSRGRATVRGRLASLLEVGTGFHPELSGRENIYLNGTILGMRRREIDRKFDEIVAFSGVERFLDTPVKRYSSGMYVRLAFAVAAHIEADILVVDEVLAVGDAEFRKKCLGKMGEVAKGGRTVLLVSHNLAALRNVCTTGLILDQGEVVLSGTAEQCIARYESRIGGVATSTWRRPDGQESGPLSITGIRSTLVGKQPHLVLDADVTLRSSAQHKPAFVAVDVSDSAGIVVLQAIPRMEGFLTARTSEHAIQISVDLPPLIPGQYRVSVWAGSHPSETLDQVKEGVAFDVHESPTPGRIFPHTKDHGFVVARSTVRYSATESS